MYYYAQRWSYGKWLTVGDECATMDDAAKIIGEFRTPGDNINSYRIVTYFSPMSALTEWAQYLRLVN